MNRDTLGYAIFGEDAPIDLEKFCALWAELDKTRILPGRTAAIYLREHQQARQTLILSCGGAFAEWFDRSDVDPVTFYLRRADRPVQDLMGFWLDDYDLPDASEAILYDGVIFPGRYVALKRRRPSSGVSVMASPAHIVDVTGTATPLVVVFDLPEAKGHL